MVVYESGMRFIRGFWREKIEYLTLECIKTAVFDTRNPQSPYRGRGALHTHPPLGQFAPLLSYLPLFKNTYCLIPDENTSAIMCHKQLGKEFSPGRGDWCGGGGGGGHWSQFLCSYFVMGDSPPPLIKEPQRNWHPWVGGGGGLLHPHLGRDLPFWDSKLGPGGSSPKPTQTQLPWWLELNYSSTSHAEFADRRHL